MVAIRATNIPDKRTIVLEQRAFQDGIGAPVEQPLPDNPVIKKQYLMIWCQIYIEAPIFSERFLQNNLINVNVYQWDYVSSNTIYAKNTKMNPRTHDTASTLFIFRFRK
jgi:hypothetical protein